MSLLMNGMRQARKIASQYDNVSYVKIDDIFYDSDVNLLGKDEFHPNKKGTN